MERIEKIEDLDSIVLMDHYHRYQWASSCVYGTVLDLACGIGYGSSIITNNTRVENYIGVDISSETIDKAKKNYASDSCCFHVGTAYDLSFIPDESIDVIVSLETIEHLDQPKVAIKEFRRVLKKDGVLLGSVPTKNLDEHHDKYHGGNKYHLTRFESEDVKQLFSEYFSNLHMYISRIRLCIETKPLIKSVDSISNQQITDMELTDNVSDIGIFLFIASNNGLPEMELCQMCLSNSVYLGPSYFDTYSKYIELHDKYIETTNLYKNLQKFYNDMEEKYIKLYSDHQELLSGGKG